MSDPVTFVRVSPEMSQDERERLCSDLADRLSDGGRRPKLVVLPDGCDVRTAGRAAVEMTDKLDAAEVTVRAEADTAADAADLFVLAMAYFRQRA